MGFIKGDTRSVDYSSYCIGELRGLLAGSVLLIPLSPCFGGLGLGFRIKGSEIVLILNAELLRVSRRNVTRRSL